MNRAWPFTREAEEAHWPIGGMLHRAITTDAHFYCCGLATSYSMVWGGQTTDAYGYQRRRPGVRTSGRVIDVRIIWNLEMFSCRATTRLMSVLTYPGRSPLL